MGRAVQTTLTLLGGLQASNSSASARLMERIREVDLHDCPKRSEFIKEIGIKSESHLSEALNHKHGKNFPLSWLPPYVLHDSQERITREIASWKSLRVLPMRVMSPQEKLARIERVLNRLGATGDAIRDEAMDLPDAEFLEDGS